MAQAGKRHPLFSVVVCTRNRGGSVVPTAKSILAVRHASFELLVIDQSDDDATRGALAALLGGEQEDPRLRFYHLARPGKANALNAARRQARGRYLVLTDDDCECDPDWLLHIERAFDQDPTLGCVFGEVLAAPHDPSLHYVSINHIPATTTLRDAREWLKMPGMRNFGIGANMAVRATALDEVGGWDPCVGPGSEFGSGDDHDLAVRLLLRGHGVRLCPEARVIHYGLRRWEWCAADVERVGCGFGAVFAKYLRCGVVYRGSLRMLTFFVRRATVRLFEPQKGLTFLRGWTRGFMRGLSHPLDRRNHRYIGVADAESHRYGGNFARVIQRGG